MALLARSACQWPSCKSGCWAQRRTLQRELERIADRADTSSTSGLHFVLQGRLAVSVESCTCLPGHCQGRPGPAQVSATEAELPLWVCVLHGRWVG